MRSIKKVKKIIESNPQSALAQTFAKLILSLETEQAFPMQTLYALNSNDFELAIEVLKDWRLDRFYIGKAKVFDASVQASALLEQTK
jgi:ATP-dependent protease HslVU (ClpYQ) peptidase subunit